jgi:hypothetical protein
MAGARDGGARGRRQAGSLSVNRAPVAAAVVVADLVLAEHLLTARRHRPGLDLNVA